MLHAQGRSIDADYPAAYMLIAQQLIADQKASRGDLKDLLHAGKDARAARGKRPRDRTSSEEQKQEERVRARSLDT